MRFKSGIFELDPWFLSLQEYAKVLIIIVPGYLVLYYGFQLYTPKRVQGRRLEAWHIIQANVIGLMAFILLLYVWKQPDFSRGTAAFFSTIKRQRRKISAATGTGCRAVLYFAAQCTAGRSS